MGQAWPLVPSSDLGLAMKKLPLLFSVADLAGVLGWSKYRTRQALKRRGLALDATERVKVLMTYNELWRQWPEIFFTLRYSGQLHEEPKG